MEAPDSPIEAKPDNAIVWRAGLLYLLDQRLLPGRTEYMVLQNAPEVATAIRDMVVRGAPAIGITAAYGVVLGAAQAFHEVGCDWKKRLTADLATLAAARPTAINLFWALRRMSEIIEYLPSSESPVAALETEATRIHQEDRDANRRMGDFGAALIQGPTTVITHCNAGALATGGYGTALGVVRSAFKMGTITKVYADETRPWLQGARLTAWELARDGIPVTLLADGAAASLLARGDVSWVIVGSDRIAANGDVANKIGTYSLAVAAKYHGVKVMVAAPTSTVDMQVESGGEIPIEQRDPAEILSCGGKLVGAKGADAWNPVFDVTPAALVDVIVTERGVIHSPNREKIEKHMA